MCLPIANLSFFFKLSSFTHAHTHTTTTTTTVVGRRPQGTLLGWFASAGSLARMLFPVMSGYVSRYGSVQMLFGIVVGVLVVATVFTTYARHTLTLLSQ